MSRHALELLFLEQNDNIVQNVFVIYNQSISYYQYIKKLKACRDVPVGRKGLSARQSYIYTSNSTIFKLLYVCHFNYS